jgi:hypothetical protein
MNKAVLGKTCLFVCSMSAALGFTELLWFGRAFWFGYFETMAAVNLAGWLWVRKRI